MSNMLEQAIVDAESLKEAARQSAEEKIVEHFSKDIKKAVDMILEQEEDLGLGDLGSMLGDTETPAQAIDVKAPKNTKQNGKFVVDQLPYASTTNNKKFVSIDLDRLEETIRHQLEEDDMNPLELEEEYALDDEMLEEMYEDEMLEETGAKDTGASKGDKGKDKEDPKDRDYVDGGMRKGDESKTHKGEKEDTTKKGEKLKHSGKGRGEKKGDEAFVNESSNLVKMIKDILMEDADSELYEEAEDLYEGDDEMYEGADKNTGMHGMHGDDDDDTYMGHMKEEAMPMKAEPEGEDLNGDGKEGHGKVPAFLEETPEEMYEAYAAYEMKERKALQQEGKSLQKKNKTLITERKTLGKKVQLLEGKLKKYGTVINKLQEKLNETNLANAKLLYQNRVLNSDSLNERQKDRIVETIMDAKTVEEAKIIYETLQSAVGAYAFKRKPKSLNEVVTKRSSAFMPRNEEKRVDPFAVRMKALAGIKE